MLIQRIATSLILAPLFIWAIFKMDGDAFAQLLLVFIAMGAWEFSVLIKLQNIVARLVLTISVVATAVFISQNALLVPWVLYVSVGWWMVNLYWILVYPHKTNLWFKPIPVRLASSFLLLVPMWIALITLHQQHGAEWFLLLILIIWGADSGAYFTGKAFGKRKLSPKVSPGKSIEGVIGGIGFALVVMLLFLQYQNIAANQYIGYLLLTVLVSSVSVLGDLFESLFKRVSNIKDSGQLLPGHGGVLDRIDSLTAAAPFFLLGLNLL